MSILIPLIVLGLVCAGAAGWFVKRHREPLGDAVVAVQDAKWSHAFADTSSPMMRSLMQAARPFGSTNTVLNAAESPAYRQLREKVVASGLYGGSVEIFLSVQALMFFVAAAAFGMAVIYRSELVPAGAFTMIGLSALLLPYNRITSVAKKRAKAIGQALPEFAELLQMPLVSGMSVVPALGFTANFVKGPVTDEVKTLIEALTTRSLPDEEAFRQAGQRLGTTESVAFFNSLGQAHVRGAKITENLSRQAASLRKKSFEEARTQIKKIPTKMVFIFALHFLPTLFFIAFIPFLYSFSQS